MAATASSRKPLSVILILVCSAPVFLALWDASRRSSSASFGELHDSIFGPGFWILSGVVLAAIIAFVYFFTYKGGRMFSGRFADTTLRLRLFQIAVAVALLTAVFSVLVYQAGTWAATYSSFAELVQLEGVVSDKHALRRGRANSRLYTTSNDEVTLVTTRRLSNFRDGDTVRVSCMMVIWTECRITEIQVVR